MEYAKVAINLPVKNLFRQFTYHVPESLDFLTQGWRVVVPFGTQLVEGFIVEEDKAPDLSRELKDIADVVGTEPWFDSEMLATAYWLSQYYLCSLAEACGCSSPARKAWPLPGIMYRCRTGRNRFRPGNRNCMTSCARKGRCPGRPSGNCLEEKLP
jgi:primosomal protein N' (replication factor Y) (superfamily II helicase)